MPDSLRTGCLPALCIAYGMVFSLAAFYTPPPACMANITGPTTTMSERNCGARRSVMLSRLAYPGSLPCLIRLTYPGHPYLRV